MTYTLTPHAKRRLQQRNITDDDVAGALVAPIYEHHHGTQMHFDRATRLALIFNPVNRQIVTVFRLKAKQVKRWCSR